ncbi:MAG: hypothetical protein GY906_11165 [bacterium]|nr:hypothetical protein [bacterium]
MKELEMMEIQVSALIDGELSRSAVLSVIDNLLEDGESRLFYRRARHLDLAIESTRDTDHGASGELWRKIEEAAGRDNESPKFVWVAPNRHLSRWLLRAAAAAVIVIGMWSVSTIVLPSSEPGNIAEIIAGSAPNSMDDERFIELTTELLQADPRYHHAMYEIVDAVSRHAIPREGMVDRNRSFFVNASLDGEELIEMSERGLNQNPPQIY